MRTTVGVEVGDWEVGCGVAWAAAAGLFLFGVFDVLCGRGMGEKRGGMSEKRDVFSCVIGWNLVTLKEKTE